MKYSGLDNKYKRRSHNIFKQILNEYSALQYPKILDVGCASGIIGQVRASSKNVFGIELDDKLSEIAKENCEKLYKINLNNFKGSNLAENNFDFIFCGDILEHLLDPESVLKELIPLLNEKGYIVISLPNIAQIQFRLSLLFGKFDYTEAGVLAKYHLHFYTYKTAVQFIKSAGLDIIKFFPSGTIVSYINILPRLLCPQLIFLCKKNK